MWTNVLPFVVENQNKKETQYIYREVVNVEIIREFLVKALEDFNENSQEKLSLVFFNETIERIV